MTTVASRGRAALDEIGEFFLFVLDVLASFRRRPFRWDEAVQQGWTLASVVIIPTALVSIPLGAVVALQIGSLTQQLGAQSFAGATSVVAIVREGAPIATALLLAGAGGSAICADFGSRTIREEIDALKVLGVNINARLVLPRLVAAMVVGVLVTGFVMGVGIAGGYFFNVVLQGGTSGVYVESFKTLATIPDLASALAKGMVFGAIAALVGSFKGLRVKGGPKGVGDAVNETVVMTFLLLFTVNYVMTTAYLQLFPQGTR
ncbi:ABC transporter permease [Aeromicrobium sp. A1-2]|uniref:MlaE family ABC transporter permease n=1 Tax=Aeromicrobium sp. A1-2 TaxID=2107713 RepID=UPI000E473EE5|nr:ABC transporter permease [Aeromicrobium sp. A1-2]AXT83927.1 ABC transporter permease [Aeromicrobium sp. A1-2]